MLFDLRGRGRRNVIKVIYLGLAVLMGGGLVLFGIGSSTSGGGLFDAFSNNSGGDVGAARYEKEITAAQGKLATDKSDEEAWIELIRAQVSLASTDEQFDATTGLYNEAGQADLRDAVASWESYQAIEPTDKEAEGRVAAIVVRAYISLEDLEGAIDAQEILALNREAVGPYSTLAQLAYSAGQIRKGDLAARKAIELEEPDQRAALKSDLDAIKAQAAPTDVIPTITASPPTGPTGKSGKSDKASAGADKKSKEK